MIVASGGPFDPYTTTWGTTGVTADAQASSNWVQSSGLVDANSVLTCREACDYKDFGLTL